MNKSKVNVVRCIIKNLILVKTVLSTVSAATTTTTTNNASVDEYMVSRVYNSPHLVVFLYKYGLLFLPDCLTKQR